jgi:predicted  nucleic acid-binding Zn-ribbon protein
MSEESSELLKGLQDLDLKLEELRRRVGEYEPLLAEIEEPALALEKEVETLKGRLQEMKLEERRLEHSADDRRTRTRKLQERSKAVRNLREEAAVQAEMDLLKMALEGDEQEALTLLDQIKKMEQRLDDQEAALKTARAEIEPRRRELVSRQEEASAELGRVKEEREIYAARVPVGDLRKYERIRNGGRTVAVATLTPDGACGNCFGMIPLQVQNEIKRGTSLVHCEFCGVLLGSGGELP